jgi:hypothetical protein
MESAVNAAILPDASGRLAGRPLEEWNGAYAKVENYFHALRIRNKVLLGDLVLRVLERAPRRAPAEPDRSATQIAAEEMERIVTEWFSEVLQSPPTKADNSLSTRGRLALLLADMPGRWQEQFLRSGSVAGGIHQRHARSFFARRAGFPDFENDAPPARPRPHHDAHQLGEVSVFPYGSDLGAVCPDANRGFYSDALKPCLKNRHRFK